MLADADGQEICISCENVRGFAFVEVGQLQFSAPRHHRVELALGGTDEPHLGRE
jgi:hypothetical protein